VIGERMSNRRGSSDSLPDGVACNRGGFGQVQLEPRDVLSQTGRTQILLARSVDHLGSVQFLFRDRRLGGQLADAGQFALGVFPFDARPLDGRLDPVPGRLGRLHPGFGLSQRAGVQDVRFVRLDCRQQRGTALHRIAGIECDPQQPPGQRRRNDVAVPDARLAVLVDRHAQRTAADGRPFNGQGLRPKRPNQSPAQDGDARQVHQGSNQQSYQPLHSRVFNTETKSK
jgi:hypothetical protein